MDRLPESEAEYAAFDQIDAAWADVPVATLAAIGREAEGREIPGYDVPLPNGCWKCIGCGKIISPRRRWNQCASCDTREPEER